MSVAKIMELSCSSTTSFEDAINQGVNRATKTLNNVTGAWVQDQKIAINNNKVTEYRVNLKVTFILDNDC